MDKYFPDEGEATTEFNNINMIKYIPAKTFKRYQNKNLVAYLKTATADQSTKKTTNVTTLVNPQWMEYYFKSIYLGMVKNQQQKWMYLPVGSNDNKCVPEEMDKTIIMSHQVDTNAKRCLFNSLSSVIMYIGGK